MCDCSSEQIQRQQVCRGEVGKKKQDGGCSYVINQITCWFLHGLHMMPVTVKTIKNNGCICSCVCLFQQAAVSDASSPGGLKRRAGNAQIVTQKRDLALKKCMQKHKHCTIL